MKLLDPDFEYRAFVDVRCPVCGTDGGVTVYQSEYGLHSLKCKIGCVEAEVRKELGLPPLRVEAKKESTRKRKGELPDNVTPGPWDGAA